MTMISCEIHGSIEALGTLDGALLCPQCVKLAKELEESENGTIIKKEEEKV